MYYLRRRNLGFSIDEWESMPWWQQWTYDEMMIADMNGELDEYRKLSDPPDGEPMTFPWNTENSGFDEYVPPADRLAAPITIDADDGPPPKYDFPPEDERDRIAPVTYLPINRLGVNVRKSKVRSSPEQSSQTDASPDGEGQRGDPERDPHEDQHQ